MLNPQRRRAVRKALCGFILAIAALGPPRPAFGFVFLDTSQPGSAAPADSGTRRESGILVTDTGAALPSPEASPDSSAPFRPAAAARAERVREHYGNVLFLSADSKLVYAYLGVLKALEEFGLEPDAVLAESKAVVVGAAWALGYDAATLEKEFLRRPLEGYLRPLPFASASDGAFRVSGPEAMQWEIPLGLQSLQAPGSKWSDVTVGASGEFLHLSWMVARLTHDAPAGPVEDLSGTPRRLAVQVSDLASEKEAVLTEGGLQNIVKGSLLPADVVRRRQRLWPYASGSLLSGHAVLSDRLPFTCDRIILVQPGHRLRPPALESGPTPWTDSLNLRAMRRVGASRPGTEGAPAVPAKTMSIELEPEGEFDPRETDPRRWIDLGYTSALRSMDVLQAVLAPKKAAPSATAAKAEGQLGLNRLSVNPLASGGRQLLLDIIRTSEGDADDSSGDGAISALVNSGFYTDLDLEWAKGNSEEKAMLVFDAKEKSKVSFRAGYNFTFAGEELPDRAPEVYGGLAWNEPFYIPFQADLGVLLGGHKPGYEARAMIAPIYPLHLELGLTRTHWETLYPFDPPREARDLGAGYLRLNRTLSEVFLKIFPMRSAYLRTAIQRHEMELPGLGGGAEEDEFSYLSTDFQETAFLGLGKPDALGSHPYTLRLRYRNLNRVNTIGQVRYATSSLESRVGVRFGDFRLSDQYFWSDQRNQASTIFDLIEAGTIDAFTFQEEYFLRYLRSTNFQDVKIEYSPVFGRAGLRLTAGAYRNYGGALFPQQTEYLTYDHWDFPVRFHWEAQAGCVTPLGTLRAGMGGLEDRKPFYFLRLGTGFELGFDRTE
ncbi:MAG TPA: hypothetical protein VJ385_17880 [Fibrobacteria bacterium]|nr:hypothetical protein [Fibrobacteria bacterium]